MSVQAAESFTRGRPHRSSSKETASPSSRGGWCPETSCAACTISACRRGASVTTELFRVGPDDLQPETVCDYFASRAEPPWPQRPAPDGDPVARRFVAEGMHTLWTHRRYVAGVLADSAAGPRGAPGNPGELMERLLVDHEFQRSTRPAAWWLERPESRGFGALARSARALASRVRPPVTLAQ